MPAGPEEKIPKIKLIDYIPEFSMQIASFIKREHIIYDLFHCHYYLSGLAVLAIWKIVKEKIPFIIMFHTLSLMKNLVTQQEKDKETQKRTHAEFLLIQHARNVIASSTMDQEYLETLYNCPKENIKVISPGVDTHYFFPKDKIVAKRELGIEAKMKTILFIGRLDPAKGTDVLLYAIKILSRRMPSIPLTLFIIGGDENDTTYKKLVDIRNMLQLVPFVHFLGKKSYESLPIYYNAADILVTPSLYESFSISSLEAMACKTPIIVTSACGIAKDIANISKHLVTSANNPIELALACYNLLTEETISHKIAKSLYNKAISMSWESVLEKTVKVYEDIYL
jgi:D-inositol-3-phosphate glycosyltransferase